VIRLLVYC